MSGVPPSTRRETPSRVGFVSSMSSAVRGTSSSLDVSAVQTPESTCRSPIRPTARQRWGKLRAAVFAGGAWLAAFAAMPPPGAVSVASVAPPNMRIGDCPRLARMVARAVVSRFIAPHAALIYGSASSAPAARWCTPVVVRLVNSFHGTALIASVFWYVVVNVIHADMPTVRACNEGNFEACERREDYANGVVSNACFHYGMLFCSVIRDQPPLVVHNFSAAVVEAVAFALRSEFPSEADQPAIDAAIPRVGPLVRQWLIGFGDEEPTTQPTTTHAEDDDDSAAKRSPERSSPATVLGAGPTEKELRLRAYDEWAAQGASPKRGMAAAPGAASAGSVATASGQAGAAAPGAAADAASDQPRSGIRRRKHTAQRTLHGRLVPRNMYFMRAVPQAQRDTGDPDDVRKPGDRSVVEKTRAPLLDLEVEHNARYDVVDTSVLAQRLRRAKGAAAGQAGGAMPPRAASAGSKRLPVEATTQRFRQATEQLRGNGFSMAQCAPLLAMFVRAAGMQASSFATGSAFFSLSDAGVRSVHLGESSASMASSRPLTPATLDAIADAEDAASPSAVVQEHGGPGTFASVDALGSILDVSRSRLHVEEFVCPSCHVEPDVEPTPLEVVLTHQQPPVKSGTRPSSAASASSSRVACALCNRNSLSRSRAAASNRSTGLQLRRCTSCTNVFCTSCCRRHVRARDGGVGSGPDGASVASAPFNKRKTGRQMPESATEVFGTALGARVFICPPPPSLDTVLQQSMRQSRTMSMSGANSGVAWARRQASSASVIGARASSAGLRGGSRGHSMARRPTSRGAETDDESLGEKTATTAADNVSPDVNPTAITAEHKQHFRRVTAWMDAHARAEASQVRQAMERASSKDVRDDGAAAEAHEPTTADNSTNLRDATTTNTVAFGDVLFGSSEQSLASDDFERDAARPAPDPAPTMRVDDFAMLQRPTSAFASVTGTRIARDTSSSTDAGDGQRRRPSTATGLRSTSTVKLTRAVPSSVLAERRERTTAAVQQATAAVKRNQEGCRRERQHLRALQRRALDVASRNALNMLQDLEHTKVLLRRGRSKTVVAAMDAVTEAMQACLVPGLSAEEEIAALEACFAAVDEHTAALEGGALTRALKFVSQRRPRHSALLREQQHARRERLLHLRHRVTQDVYGGEAPKSEQEQEDLKRPPATDAEEAVSALRASRHPVTDRGRERLQQEVSAIMERERGDVRALFDGLSAVRTNPRRGTSGAPPSDQQRRPGGDAQREAKRDGDRSKSASKISSFDYTNASWTDSRFSQLLHLHRAPPSNEATGEMQLIEGRLTWTSSGKHVGASADEIMTQLAARDGAPGRKA